MSSAAARSDEHRRVVAQSATGTVGVAFFWFLFLAKQEKELAKGEKKKLNEKTRSKSKTLDSRFRGNDGLLRMAPRYDAKRKRL